MNSEPERQRGVIVRSGPLQSKATRVVIGALDPCRDWQGARALLQAVQERVGAAAVRDAMLKERVALHWFEPSLGQVMLPQQVERSLELAGGVVGHLPNVMLGQNPVLEGLAVVLTPLLMVSGPWHIVVERSDQVDLESVRLFLKLLEHRARDCVVLEVGRVEADTRALAAARIDEELQRMGEFLGASVQQTDLLVGPATPPPTGALEEALARARTAFDAHAFSVSLRLAELLLAEGSELEEASRIAGSSAHHLGPHDPVASTHAALHFGRLLELTKDPGSASYALYRLCLHQAKHGGSLDRAQDFALRALESAQQMKDGRAAYFSAWARNGRAYVLYRLNRFEEAKQECERASAELSTTRSVAVPRREVDETLNHLQANAMRVQRMIAR